MPTSRSSASPAAVSRMPREGPHAPVSGSHFAAGLYGSQGQPHITTRERPAPLTSHTPWGELAPDVTRVNAENLPSEIATGYRWRPATLPSAIAVLIHGLQSHAGWFLDAGEHLAAHGLAVYA